MRRFAWGTTLVALLGLGGLALGQEGLIVNPWPHGASPPPLASPWKESGRPEAGPLHVSNYEVSEPSSPAAVVPLWPLRPRPSAVEPLGALTYDDVVNPWVQSEPGALGGHSDGARAVDRHWAREIQEIVDPWASGPLAVAIDPAIVDPWASSGR